MQGLLPSVIALEVSHVIFIRLPATLAVVEIKDE